MHIHVREPARRGRVLLPEGRYLAFSEWGPASGVPVLFCPGAGSSSFLGFGPDVVDALGIRLVGLDRPGLGASDPAPGRTLSDYARDVSAFAAACDLEAPRVVGFSQGAPFALACAAAGAVRAAAIVAGTDELASEPVCAALVPAVRAMVDEALADPDGAEARFRGMSPAALLGMVQAMSPACDRAVYSEPEFAAAYRRALDEGFSQGPDGYARDTVLASRPWPFDPSAIAVPVDLWYGREDTSPVHSPDLGASLARRIPASRRTVVDGIGGAVLWTHAREILEALLAR